MSLLNPFGIGSQFTSQRRRRLAFVIPIPVILSILTALPVFATQVWTTAAPLPTGRTELGAATAGGRIYAVGGDVNLNPVSTVERYDPHANTWTTVSSLPAARANLAAAAARGLVYAIGGVDVNFNTVNTVTRYDPASNTWTTVAPLPTARRRLAAAAGFCPGSSVTICVYAIGGRSDVARVATVEVYNPTTNVWTTVMPMPTAREELAAASIGRFIYALGGSNTQGFSVNTVERYDTLTNTWSTIAGMPTAREALGAAAFGRLYAFGGDMNGTILNTAERYDPSTNTWTTLPPMPTAREALAEAGALCIGSTTVNCLYAIGGNDGNPQYSTVEAFG